jgi:hypothetical protein
MLLAGCICGDLSFPFLFSLRRDVLIDSGIDLDPSTSFPLSDAVRQNKGLLYVRPFFHSTQGAHSIDLATYRYHAYVYSLLAGQTKRDRASKEGAACPSFTGTAAVAQTRLFEKVKFEY